MANEGPASDPSTPPRSAAEIWRLLAAAVAAGRLPGPTTSEGATRPAVGPDAPDVLRFLSEVWFAYLGSGLRSWERAMEAWVRTLPVVSRAMVDGFDTTGLAPEARAVVLDELRRHLRELAEYPQQESKWLQGELDRIAATIWPAAAPDVNGPYWRRWQAKR